MLTAMPSSATAPRWPRIGDFRTIRLYRIAEDHTIGNLVADDGLLALVPERHLDGKTDCPADAGLRDSRAGDRHLRCSDRLSPVTEDRPHFYVQTLDAASADAPGRRVPVDAVPRARALHARQAGSRLPLAAEDGRLQISGDVRAQRQAQGTSAAAFLPDAPGRSDVPSP